MTVFATAYDTSVGSAALMSTVDQTIQNGLVLNGTDDTNLGIITSLSICPLFITGMRASDSKIPLFAHPRIVAGIKGQLYLCTDVRQIVRAGTPRDNETLVIKNKTEYTFARLRTALNLLWLVDPPLQLKTMLPLAGTVFAAWLSGSLARRYALNPADQLKLNVLSHLYYQNLFLPGDTIDTAYWDPCVIQAAKATRAAPDLVYTLLEQVGPLGSVAQLCVAAQQLTENVRLNDLNMGVLVTLLGTSWFGLNAKEILAVALEHPPTWMALVYIVLFEKTYRNSLLARFAEQAGKASGTAQYIRSIRDLLEELQDPTTPALETLISVDVLP